MSEEIDFTKMRKGTKTRGAAKIEVCPKCGRKGERGRYKDGSGCVNHKGKIIGIAGFQMLEITDHCFLKKGE